MCSPNAVIKHFPSHENRGIKNTVPRVKGKRPQYQMTMVYLALLSLQGVCMRKLTNSGGVESRHRGSRLFMAMNVSLWVTTQWRPKVRCWQGPSEHWPKETCSDLRTEPTRSWWQRMSRLQWSFLTSCSPPQSLSLCSHDIWMEQSVNTGCITMCLCLQGENMLALLLYVSL